MPSPGEVKTPQNKKHVIRALHRTDQREKHKVRYPFKMTVSNSAMKIKKLDLGRDGGSKKIKVLHN